MPRLKFFKERKREVFMEFFVTKLLGMSAGLTVLLTLILVGVLLKDSAHFFSKIPIEDFLFGTNWSPLIEPRSFGILPLVCGTFLVASGAGLIAIPVGLGIGIYLSEYAHSKVRGTVKPMLEIMAGIPSVVYGYFALTAITPMLQSVFPDTQAFNAASASIVVAIMVLPMVCSLCDDALRAVPRSLREGGLALGATRWEVASRIVLPGAFSGVMASFILALSRAIGETMAVALAAGATPVMGLNPLKSIQTLTGYIVQVSLGDTPQDSIEYYSIFAVGLTLFVMTFFMNILALVIRERYRVRYN